MSALLTAVQLGAVQLGAVQLGAVPVEPSRGQARQLLQRELAGREYEQQRPGVLERVIQWFWDRFDGLQLTAGGSLRPAAIVIATTLVLAVVAYALYRSGGFTRQARVRGPAVLDDAGATAADHRATADRAAAAGDWDAALVARFRAVARSLEERTILVEQPGRTAREVARDAGRMLPGLAAELTAAADAFDEVSYGHRHVGESTYTAVRSLDERLAAARARDLAEQVPA